MVESASLLTRYGLNHPSRVRIPYPPQIETSSGVNGLSVLRAEVASGKLILFFK